MNSKEQLITEFELRVFDESYPRIKKCLSVLSEEQIWSSPNENIAPIACLILHLSGNARQWILSGLGSSPDLRIRDEEFMIYLDLKKKSLIDQLDELELELRDCLNKIDEEVLNTSYKIQGFNVSGFSVVIHVLEHFSYHTGQISTLTKLISNVDLAYYSDSDLNSKT